jgi:hypothetical protein
MDSKPSFTKRFEAFENTKLQPSTIMPRYVKQKISKAIYIVWFDHKRLLIIARLHGVIVVERFFLLLAFFWVNS